MRISLRISVMTPGQAAKAFRKKLGVTQQQFATEAGISIRSVAKYDTGGEPSGSALFALAQLARKHKETQLARIFITALLDEIGLKDQGFSNFHREGPEDPVEGILITRTTKESTETERNTLVLFATVWSLARAKKDSELKALALTALDKVSDLLAKDVIAASEALPLLVGTLIGPEMKARLKAEVNSKTAASAKDGQS